MARVQRHALPPMLAAASCTDEGFSWERSFAGSRIRVLWGQPAENGSTGNEDFVAEIALDPDQDGSARVGHLHSPLWSSDHRPRCGADTPGLAAKRCSASGDAYAIYDQCERRYSQGMLFVPRLAITGSSQRLGSRGEWLTIRAIGKRTFSSPPDVGSFFVS